jgi:hypothetical protein
MLKKAELTTTPTYPETYDELQAMRLKLAAQIEELSNQDRVLRSQLELVRERQKMLEDKKVLQNIDFLMDVFASGHSRTSCSDENYYGDRCRRCLLLRAKKEQHISFSMELIIESD